MDFKATECIHFGWETFKKRPWILIGMLAVTTVVSYAVGYLTGLFGSNGFGSFIGFVLSAVAHTFIGMGITAFLLKAHESIESVTLNEMWHPNPFGSYFAVTILYSLAVLIGLILLVIPGIIISLAYQFGGYIVIDRNMGPVEALKESARITKGHRWELFWLLLLVVGLNVLGALALLIGLLVTIPVTCIAIVHAYRTLGHQASEAAPVSAVHV